MFGFNPFLAKGVKIFFEPLQRDILEIQNGSYKKAAFVKGEKILLKKVSLNRSFKNLLRRRKILLTRGSFPVQYSFPE